MGGYAVTDRLHTQNSRDTEFITVRICGAVLFMKCKRKKYINRRKI